jgi:hypothetical protein
MAWRQSPLISTLWRYGTEKQIAPIPGTAGFVARSTILPESLLQTHSTNPSECGVLGWLHRNVSDCVKLLTDSSWARRAFLIGTARRSRARTDRLSPNRCLVQHSPSSQTSRWYASSVRTCSAMSLPGCHGFEDHEAYCMDGAAKTVQQGFGIVRGSTCAAQLPLCGFVARPAGRDEAGVTTGLSVALHSRHSLLIQVTSGDAEGSERHRGPDSLALRPPRSGYAGAARTIGRCSGLPLFPSGARWQLQLCHYRRVAHGRCAPRGLRGSPECSGPRKQWQSSARAAPVPSARVTLARMVRVLLSSNVPVIPPLTEAPCRDGGGAKQHPEFITENWRGGQRVFLLTVPCRPL